MKQSIELFTSRLVLVGAESASLRAEQIGPEAFAAALEATVPTSWPPEHHDTNVIDWLLKSLVTLAPSDPWRMFYMMLRDPLTLVGICGFKGPPDSTKCVEVGYSVLPEFRCNGLAKEAVMKLISTAFDFGVSEVAAETYPSLIASLRVMERSGMTFIGDGADHGTLRYSIKQQ